MEINIDRIWNRIMSLGDIAKDNNNGITRFPFTKEYEQSINLVKSWMNSAGLKTWIDEFGNLFGRREGRQQQPALLIGSHIDSVKNGGMFDGVAGVISALEVLQIMEDIKFDNNIPIEVAVFNNEEGSRFPGGLMGSMLVTGQLKKELIENVKDNQGIYMRDAMKEYGFNIDSVLDVKRKSDSFNKYIEVHIEQSVVLEENNYPIGIVTGVAGPYQMILEIEGKTGHSGATPMKGRNDPMVAAAIIIQEVENAALESNGKVNGTVGYIKAFPGGHNIIPQKVEMTLDFRGEDIDSRNKVTSKIKGKIDDICVSRGLKYNTVVTQNTPPVSCDAQIIDLLKEGAEALEIPYMFMPSGAAHDAMIMSSVCPIGMIFIRSIGGLSHCQEEYSKKEDIALATEILLYAVKKFSY